MLSDETVDSILNIEDRLENTAFQAAFGDLGEEALDGLEPRTKCRGEVDGEARMSGMPERCLSIWRMVICL
jgi:hypothetical protein